MSRYLLRVFGNAFARRVAYLIVAILLAALGMGNVRAQDFGNCTAGTATDSPELCPDQASAYSGVMAAASRGLSVCSSNPFVTEPCTLGPVTGPSCSTTQCTYKAVVLYKNVTNRSYLRAYAIGKTCDSRPSTTSSFMPKSGSISCSEGCTQYWFRNGDGTSTGKYGNTACSTTDFKDTCGSGFYWNQTLSVCEPVKEDCPAGQKPNASGDCAPEPCPEGMAQQPDGTCKAKENECPAGEVKSPDGSCIKKPDACGAGQAQGNDGTCKPDKDGDGTPDDEDSDDDGEDDKKSFSGGDDCGSPPSCSGDPIMCGQARIQWRIECNTRRNVNIAGGACTAAPVCTGQKCDAMEYAQLLVQWRTACAVEKLKNGASEGGQKGDANGNGVADVLEGTGTVTGPGDGDADVAGAKRFGIGISTDLIDKENIFGGGACPQPPTFKFYGTTISGADFPYFCQAAAILRALILIWGAYTALKILMNGGF